MPDPKSVEDYMAEGLSQREAEQRVQLDAMFVMADKTRFLEMTVPWANDGLADREEEY